MKKIILFFLVSISFTNILSAQNLSRFEYISPRPNTIYASINSKILIRPGQALDRSSINNDILSVIGSKSGNHFGIINLSDDSKTIIFSPSNSFQPDEDVTVKLNNGVKTADGINIGNVNFKFHTVKNSSPLNLQMPPLNFSAQNINPKVSTIVKDSSLPPSLPYIKIDQSNNPSSGYFFLCPNPYIMIVDNQGTPVFYRNVKGIIYDFDLQPDGELTYFIYPTSCYGLDGSLNLVRTFSTTDGFTPDVHELRVLPNGNYYILGKRNVTLDMSQIVHGGQTAADIIDGDIQEFDSSGNLIFEWDGLDHYQIIDVDDYVDLTQPTIDFTHFNSIEIDTDGNLLVSARNLDEITKVDRNTGKIIWRWGGRNNQFKFINDSIGFSRQHDIRLFSNGDFSIFDNGVYHQNQISSAVEYKVDEINKTATLIRRISNYGIFTNTEGSVEELPNGNRLISWGHNFNPLLTEVMPDSSIAAEVSYFQYYDTYRAFKYKWQTTLFTTNLDSIDFGKVAVGDSSVKNITIYNPKDSALTINEFFCNNTSFSTNANVPLIIQPKDSTIIQVMFKPSGNGNYNTSFNIRNISYYQSTQQMIARQVLLKGITQNISLINNGNEIPNSYELFQNYPNPFNPSTVIKYELEKAGFVKLRIYDELGRKVKTLVNEVQSSGEHSETLDASSFPSGIYFYQLEAGSFISTKKMILLK